MITEDLNISHYSKSNIIIWMLMATQAGVLNIGGYLACHRFVSHVTGFFTLFGNELARLNYISALKYFIIPLFFLLGVIISGVFIDLRLLLKKRPKYYVVFIILFFLNFLLTFLGVNGYLGVFGEPLINTNDYILLIFICFICGMQNGAITSVSRYVIRTTHMTGLTTDLGIGLVRIFNKNLIPTIAHAEVQPTIMRLLIILSFTFGSALGALIFNKFLFYGFLLPTLNSALIAFYIILNKRKNQNEEQV